MAKVTEKPDLMQIPAPDLKVIERGLANPFGLPSAPVELKDARYTTHWCNTGIGGNQLGKYLDAGYLKVRPEYLKDPDRVSFRVSEDGYVVTGNRGEEILMYTTKENDAERQRRKAALNQRGMRSSETKAELVEAAGKQLGDEAADFINRRGGIVGGVRDNYERVERREEVE